MRKCYYIDTFAVGHTHEVFNASLLEMLTRIFAGKVVCRASRSSYAHISRLMDRDAVERVEYRPLRLPEGKGRWSMLARYVSGVFSTLRILVGLPKESLAVIPYDNALALRPINRLNRILRHRILICCHGELEWLTNDAEPAGILNRRLARCVRRFFNGGSPLSAGLYFGILGDRLKDNLSELLPCDRMERFVAFDHPCPVADEMASMADTSRGDKLIISTVGALNRQKGAEALIEFVESLPAECRDKVEVRLTGSVIGIPEDRLRDLGVHVSENRDVRSRTQLLEELADADWLLFLYSNGYYKVTASGAIMDALALGKRVLALRNDYFEYLSDKFGVFGVMEPTPAQLSKRIAEIMEEGQRPDPDFDAIRTALSPRNVAVRLRGELERVGLVERIPIRSGTADEAAVK